MKKTINNSSFGSSITSSIHSSPGSYLEYNDKLPEINYEEQIQENKSLDHIQSHLEMFQCSICHEQLNCLSGLKQHMTKKHEKKNTNL